LNQIPYQFNNYSQLQRPPPPDVIPINHQIPFVANLQQNSTPDVFHPHVVPLLRPSVNGAVNPLVENHMLNSFNNPRQQRSSMRPSGSQAYSTFQSVANVAANTTVMNFTHNTSINRQYTNKYKRNLQSLRHANKFISKPRPLMNSRITPSFFVDLNSLERRSEYLITRPLNRVTSVHQENVNFNNVQLPQNYELENENNLSTFESSNDNSHGKTFDI